MTQTTLGEHLYWSYANLGMAHAAVEQGAEKYRPLHFMIRSRLYKGLCTGKMNVASLVEDERLKMILPQACCYCGSRELLSIDHLIPTKRGGEHSGENLVWACRTCNSAKGARDVLEWLASKGEFPPLLLLRRYLKLTIEHCQSAELMASIVAEVPELPMSISAIPLRYPAPSELRLWVMPLDGEIREPGKQCIQKEME
jgi:hypothetical protein